MLQRVENQGVGGEVSPKGFKKIFLKRAVLASMSFKSSNMN